MARKTMKYQLMPNEHVTVSTAKDSRGYYRIRYKDPRTDEPVDLRRKDKGEAVAEAKAADEWIANYVAGADKTRQSVQALMDYWTNPHDRGDIERANATQDNIELNCRRLGRVPVPFGDTTVAFADLPLEAWTPAVTTAVLIGLREEGLAPGTRHVLFNLMKTLVSVGQKKGYLNPDVAQDPMSEITAPPRSGKKGAIDPKDLPTMKDVERLARAMERNDSLPWWSGLRVRLAATSGLRAGELHALHVDHIDMDQGTIYVEQQVRYDRHQGQLVLTGPKGSTRDKLKDRTTVFPLDLLGDALERRIAEVKDEDMGGILFPSYYAGGYQSHPAFLSAVFNPVRMTLPGWNKRDKRMPRRYQWSWHDLRHLFCSMMLLDLGQDVTDVCAWAGHASPSFTLDTYVGRRQGAEQRAQDAFAHLRIDRDDDDPPLLSVVGG